jgi:secernin
MCDTMVALGNSTEDGSIIFAKNSDRDANEAQEILIIPGKNYPENSKTKCTYIEIPQVKSTSTVLLARPFWIWGCEMGANEFGVVIGNEALFTKAKVRKEPGLIGMDFIRLALERTRTAFDALKMIIQLLETYGQSGNCSNEHGLYYHNSFLIADQKEAWVLETADYQWAAKKVKDVYSISNAITIENEWDMKSDELVKYAIDHKWCKGRDDFSFKRCYSEFLHTYFSKANYRQQCSTHAMQTSKGKINSQSMINILRSHPSEGTWTPDKSLTEWGVCMHWGFGPFRVSQSVGSMVSHITPGQITHWLTGTSAPCTSIFKPVWIDSGFPSLGRAPTNKYDPESLWWKHEILHREVLKDYPRRMESYRQERDNLEENQRNRIKNSKDLSLKSRKELTREAFDESNSKTIQWISKIRSQKISNRNRWYYSHEWDSLNKKAGIYDHLI